MIAGLLDQPYLEKAWNQSEEAAGFYHGKAAVVELCQAFDIRDLTYEKIEGDELPWLHPSASAMIKFKSEVIGYVGELHPRTAKSFDLDFAKPPTVFELDLEPLLKAQQVQKTFQSATSKFPPVTRDLAFVVDKSVSHEDFVVAFSKFNRKKNLKSHRIFDVYQGDNLDTEKKSMAFSLIFQSEKKSLTDKEVEKEVSALITWFKEQLSAELR